MRSILFLLGVVTTFSFAAEGTTLSVDPLLQGDVRINDLISWELHRLKDLEGDPQIEFPKNLSLSRHIARDFKWTEPPRLIPLSSLQAFLKTKPSLSEEEKQQLLGVLRMANALYRTEEKEPSTAFRNSVVDELKKIARVNDLPLRLPPELQPEMDSVFKEIEMRDFPKSGITPRTLARVLSSPRFDPKKIKSESWAKLLGNIRSQAPTLRKNEFLGDFKADRWEDVIASLPKLLPGEIPTLNPFKSFKYSEPEIVQEVFARPDDEPQRPFISGHSVLPHVDLPTLRGFIVPPSPALTPFGEFGGQSTGGEMFMDLSALGDGVGKVSPEVLREKSKGAFSLLMRTSYQGRPGEFASCQITLVKEEKLGDKCSYVGATAKHCIRDEQHPTAAMTRLEIDPFGKLENHSYQILTDKEPGHEDYDFALIQFKSACKPVRIVPLRSPEEPPPDEIVVDTVRGTLVGKTRNALKQDPSLLALDVRSPQNGGLGIYPGDSGGGVATVSAQGELELAGVISSKPTDPALHGIGFFAAKDALRWANDALKGRDQKGMAHVTHSLQGFGSASTHQ